MAGKKSPWGGGSGDDGDSDGGKPTGSEGGDKPKGPRNPWLPPGSGGGSGDGRRGPNIEDIFKSRGPEGPRRSGGGGPGGPNFRFPQRPGGKSWFPLAVAGIVIVGLLATSVHLVGPQQEGVVKTLGNYTRNMEPGLNFSLPFPIETVDIEDVEGVRSVRIPGNDNQAKLILTGDQNLVDLSYIVRWNIKDLANYKFRVVDPIETVNEAAEAAMRAAVSASLMRQFTVAATSITTLSAVAARIFGSESVSIF